MVIIISDKIDFKTKVLLEMKGKIYIFYWSLLQEGIIITKMLSTNGRASKYMR